MNIPAQSSLGSYASRRCHLYFCSQEQSLLQRAVEVFLKYCCWRIIFDHLDTCVQISWCTACSNSLLLTTALSSPLLFIAQNGVSTSLLDSHTSFLNNIIKSLFKHLYKSSLGWFIIVIISLSLVDCGVVKVFKHLIKSTLQPRIIYIGW